MAIGKLANLDTWIHGPQRSLLPTQVWMHGFPHGAGKEGVQWWGGGAHRAGETWETGPQASWQTTNQSILESTPLSVLDKGLPQVSWDTSAAIIPLVNPVPCSRPGGFQAMRADHSRPPAFAVGKPGSGSEVAQPHQESCEMQRGSSI